MKKFMSTLFALALLGAVVGHAQVPGEDTYPLAVNWDMDGEGADTDQVVIAANGALTDSKTFTLTANPDICRWVDITITDANASIVAGVLTVAGTDCWGDPLTATFTFSGGGDGTYSLTQTASSKASGPYFATVTSVTTGVLTGEDGGDVVIVGYFQNSPFGYPAYGTRVDIPYAPYRYVSLDGKVAETTKVVATGTTALAAATAGTNPFARVAVGDLIGINPPNATMPLQWRKVVARADADNVTLDFAISTVAAGQGFWYKKFFLSTDPQDGWLRVGGNDALQFTFDVRSGTNTGGQISDVRCTNWFTSTPAPASAMFTTTVASGTTATVGYSIDRRLTPYEMCRIGVKFGTGDDTDAGPANTENIYISLQKRK